MPAAADIPALDFLGVRLNDLGVRAAAETIAARVPELPFVYVITPNAQHLVRLARGDEVWRRAYERAWLVLMDGRVVPMLARLLFGQRLPQASGSDLTVELMQNHVKPDDPIAVIGGGAVLEQALIDRYGFTRLRVHNPPMGFIRDPEAVSACVDFLVAHPARYVFLAVGAPQSEILAEAVIAHGGSRGVGLCIGSSLLFATGLVKRAPLWVQKAGLEAFYRLVQRPGTHFRRIFVESLPVIWILLRARLGGPGILRAAGDGPPPR